MDLQTSKLLNAARKKVLRLSSKHLKFIANFRSRKKEITQNIRDFKNQIQTNLEMPPEPQVQVSSKDLAIAKRLRKAQIKIIQRAYGGWINKSKKLPKG